GTRRGPDALAAARREGTTRGRPTSACPATTSPCAARPRTRSASTRTRTSAPTTRRTVCGGRTARTASTHSAPGRTAMADPVRRLRRLRWAVRATLALGVAASVTANVLHADPNPISQTIAAWPPVALLLTVELISRVPVHRRALAAVRLAATALIAGIAAWVSYWHMVGVAARYGETGASPYLLPLSVDGLIVVASVCLVELAGRIADAERTVDVPAVQPVPVASSNGRAAEPARPARKPSARPSANGRRTVPAATVEHALDVARTWPADRPLTRDGLAAALRQRGLSASNGRAGELLRAVRSAVPA